MRLWEVAHQEGITLERLIKAAYRLGMTVEVSNEQRDDLLKEFGRYHLLSRDEIAEINVYLAQKELLNEAARIFPTLEQEDKTALLDMIAQSLYEEMPPSPLKKRLTPITLQETITNLGLLSIGRNGGSAGTGTKIIRHLGHDLQERVMYQDVRSRIEKSHDENLYQVIAAFERDYGDSNEPPR
jgi:hypothetical protein